MNDTDKLLLQLTMFSKKTGLILDTMSIPDSLPVVVLKKDWEATNSNYRYIANKNHYGELQVEWKEVVED